MLKISNSIEPIILASFVMPILLAGILIWFFISYQKKKFQNENDKKDALLREQALLIEKHQAIEAERTRIAAEMHDDLGSGLTTIRYLSEKAIVNAKSPGEIAQITRIAEHSNRLVRNMSEIIWAMNARFDNAESLVSYLRRFASELLEEHHIRLQFQITGNTLDDIPVSAEKRRNIFLVVKEALHNSIKYSGSSAIEMNINMGNNLQMTILEKEGKGFNPDQANGNGNGIYNMRKRMESIDGTIDFVQLPSGMEISLSIPITQSHVEV